MKRLILTIASGFYTGYFPIVPGTVGSLPAWFLAWFWLGHSQTALVLAAIVVTIVSIWASGRAEKHLGEDSKKIVIDEWAGTFITLLFLPCRLDVYIAAFALFRYFDVIKPFPANWCEKKLPGGWGVTGDDMIAALYANLVSQLGLVILGRLGWLGF